MKEDEGLSVTFDVLLFMFTQVENERIKICKIKTFDYNLNMGTCIESNTRHHSYNFLNKKISFTAW